MLMAQDKSLPLHMKVYLRGCLLESLSGSSISCKKYVFSDVVFYLQFEYIIYLLLLLELGGALGMYFAKDKVCDKADFLVKSCWMSWFKKNLDHLNT